MGNNTVIPLSELVTIVRGRNYPDISLLTDDQIAADLNSPKQGCVVVKERLCTAGTLLSKLGPIVGASILDKMEAAQTAIPALKWAMKLLFTTGIDAGDAGTRMMIDYLEANGVLTAEECVALKGLGEFVVSEFEYLGYNPVTYDQINAVRRLV